MAIDNFTRTRAAAIRQVAKHNPDGGGGVQLTIWPRCTVTWCATAAALQDEGLIPPGFEWPERIGGKSWVDSEFSYYLARTRPDGRTKSSGDWKTGDWWWLRRMRHADRAVRGNAAEVYRAKCEYEAALWQQTPAWDRQYEQARQAKKDERFQTFLLRALEVQHG